MKVHFLRAICMDLDGDPIRYPLISKKYKVLKHFNDFTELELSPITGRTHQLRVHCKEIGHPILNDMKYGGKKVLRKEKFPRLCLHAYKINIENYFGKTLNLQTPRPNFTLKI